MNIGAISNLLSPGGASSPVPADKSFSLAPGKTKPQTATRKERAMHLCPRQRGSEAIWSALRRRLKSSHASM